MITLYGFGSGFGLPEMGPHVVKTEVQLKMSGLPFRKALACPDLAPKGQLPFIEDAGEAVADSTFIRAHLEARYGLDLDAGLGPAERARAWAIERMVENHLGWCVIHARWLLEPNFVRGPGRLLDGAPEAVRREAWRRVNAEVRAVALGRHSDDEIADLGEKSLEALSLLLGEQRFLFGDQAVGVDASAFAMTAAVLSPFFESPLRRRAERFANLVAYRDRMMRRFYPDFAAAEGRLERSVA